MFHKLLSLFTGALAPAPQLKLLYGETEIILDSNPEKMIIVDHWPVGHFWHDEKRGWMISLGMQTALVWPDQSRSYGWDGAEEHIGTDIWFRTKEDLQNSTLEFEIINGYTTEVPRLRSLRLVAA